jgi:hypothetical protein
MPRLIAITVYEVDEVCDELARRTGKHKRYSHTRVIDIIHEYLPGVEKAGRRYFLTEAEVAFLAERLQTNKRPKKY